MKRVLLSLVLALCAAFAYAGGIATSRDLSDFALACNAGQDIGQWQNADGTVCLEADIDMSKEKKFEGIRTFGGKFDGCGFAITNWKAKGGLFGELAAGASVRNLRIDASCSMKAANKAEEYAVGFIADINNGIIENCENHGEISHKSGYTAKDVYIGGITGSNRFAVMNCRNYGSISSTAVSTSQEGEISVHIGGIAGGGYLKTEECPAILGCVNYGTIRYDGDFPVCNIAGILGCGFRVPVKLCVNRGNIEAGTVRGEPANSKIIPQVRVGGIVALTKGDVMSCDNFGNISASGSHSPNVGGVCAVPHSAVVVGDCVNYGTVKVSNDVSGSVGGISGGVNRPARIRGCLNYGDVIYEGYSPDRRSSVGGIVGAVSVKSDATAGTYVRNCANYGRVSAGAGSNNYGNSDKAIHTGGIAGWMSGSDRATVILKDCGNFGEVTSAGGRRGNISGACSKVQLGGEYADDRAVSAEPMPDGSNVFGRVSTAEGAPVAGVVVSDGRQCVITGSDGSYAMKSDLSDTRFVHISLPAAYQVPAVSGMSHLFRRIGRYEKAVKADFTLVPRKELSDDFTMLMVADPQIRPYGMDNSTETYRDDVAPDIRAFCDSAGTECYAVVLGDLIYNYMVAYDDYIDITSGIGCTSFSLMGNHDYDQTTMYGSDYGSMFYETYMGPRHYSFNIGKIHFAVLDNIIYDRTSAKDLYRLGLEEDAVSWLENDLKFLPDTATVVLCSHSQMFKKRVSHSTTNQNYNRYLAAVARFPRVYSWAGHNHENYNFNYAGKNMDRDNISCITVSRATGALRLNEYLNHDGTPQGYMVASVSGGEMTWYYKSVGRDKDYQMRVYPPLSTDGRHILANIWNYGDGWSNAEWWENGVKIADMEKVEAYDPDYEALYATVKNETTRKYCAPVKSDRMFRIRPSDNVRSGEVRVTDLFGNVYISRISW